MYTYIYIEREREGERGPKLNLEPSAKDGGAPNASKCEGQCGLGLSDSRFQGSMVQRFGLKAYGWSGVAGLGL